MSRLTRKVQLCRDLITGRELKYEAIEDDSECIDKLGELEDIEEELGIDLLTLFKALKQGSCGVAYMFVQNDYNENYKKGLIKPLIINYIRRKSNEKSFQLNLYDSLTCKYYMVDTKDYGKTWALTKEELEDDK